MELPSRARGDVLLPAGEMVRIRERLRTLAGRHDLATVIACAFDHRTRILPFIYADLRMVPAGVRAIGSALVDSGFSKTRIVLQQWNRNFSPAEMQLDGRIPDIFMVSSMHLHSSECDRLIQEACQVDARHRPLIIAGGPRIIYEPWHVFSADPNGPVWAADVAVTGEEYVLLQLLETLLELKSPNESLRQAFLRARDAGALDGIPGIVYAKSSRPEGPAEELIDTGIQRLVGDLDELPLPVLGYRLLEPPGNSRRLGATALTDRQVRKHCKVSSIVLTIGCKFRCSYCPIPAYNQRTHRVKSGERVADEMEQITRTYGINVFFGTDDNYFNSTDKTLDISGALARRAGRPDSPIRRIRWGTEATVHDTIRLREHLPLIRQGRLCAVWMGVEDLTATLVNKGQSESKTIESFQLLRDSGIMPIPMMMHCDSQPLLSWGTNYGLINQLRTLRKAGALYTQVLMLTPSSGSKWYEETYTSGLAFDSLDGQPIEPYMVDGNYVVASKHKRPWVKQLNLLAGYTYFFNPLRMLVAAVASKSRIPLADEETWSAKRVGSLTARQKLFRRAYLKSRAHFMDAGIQLFGMGGLALTYRRTLVWAWRLLRGQIEHADRSPASRLPMRSPSGGAASHALPGTPTLQPPEPVLLPIIERPSLPIVELTKVA